MRQRLQTILATGTTDQFVRGESLATTNCTWLLSLGVRQLEAKVQLIDKVRVAFITGVLI